MNKSLLITPKKITKALLSIVCLLLVLHLLCVFLIFGLGRNRIFDFMEVFYFDKPVNAQAFYSTIAMMLCAGVLWFIGNLQSEYEKKLRLFWKILSFVFAFLSVDELVSIHENLSFLGNKMLGDTSIGGGYFYFSWYIPYVLLFAVIALFLIKSFFKLPYKYRISFAVAGIVFIAGAVGMEMICSRYYFTHQVLGLNYVLLLTVEELLEMLGIIIFIHSLTSYYFENVNLFITVVADDKRQKEYIENKDIVYNNTNKQ